MDKQKNILILTMCCNQEFFQNQEKFLRQHLYAKDILENKYNNIQYWTYTASTDNKFHINKKKHILQIPCDDTLSGTYEKTLGAFKLLDNINFNYDYILRTNCSTYINVELLNIFVNSLSDNDNHIYAGNVYCSDNGTGPFEYCYYGTGNSLLLPKYWVDIIKEYHVDKFRILNKVSNQTFKVDDNAIGLIVNSYLMLNDLDMHEIWRSFTFPVTNMIPENPEDFIIIPFRIYNIQNDRSLESAVALQIHEKVTQFNKDKSKEELINHLNKVNKIDEIRHVINFSKGMNTIVTKEFCDEFIKCMCFPIYIKNIQNKLK